MAGFRQLLGNFSFFFLLMFLDGRYSIDSSTEFWNVARLLLGGYWGVLAGFCEVVRIFFYKCFWVGAKTLLAWY